LRNMSRTWELFALTPPPNTSFEATKLARTTNMTWQWSGPHWVKLNGFFLVNFVM
jgi:hypothetical protein